MNSVPPTLCQQELLRFLTKEEVHRKLLSKTGEWALSSENSIPDFSPEEAPFLAREIALRQPCDRPADLPPEITGCPLAGPGSPSLSSLEEAPFACAVFPMTNDRKANLGLVVDWGQDEPAFVAKNMDRTSRSWELAWQLCRHFRDTPPIRLSLAAQWLITGRCGPEGSVSSVILKQKTLISNAIHRTFLLPYDNLSDFEIQPGYFKRRLTAANLSSAIAHLLGQGTTDSGTPEGWPNTIDEFHTFVSESTNPVCILALLVHPAPVHLWCSPHPEKSRNIAKWLVPFLVEDFNLKSKVDLADECVPDDSVAGVERFLNRQLAPRLTAGTTVLFNFTQGNKLMSMGVTELARRHPNLWLIYRNTDACKPGVLQFDLVHFPGGQPHTRRVETQLPSLPHIQVEKLTSFKRYTCREEASADLIRPVSRG